MNLIWWYIIVVSSYSYEIISSAEPLRSKHKRSIDVQTGYVFRKTSERTPHYSVILGSSGKTILGPSVLSPDQDQNEIHRVQGFVVKDDEVEAEESSSFTNSAISLHNRYRMLHHSSPLIWSDRLAKQAKKIAYSLARNHATSSKRSQLVTETLGENVEKLYSVNYKCDNKAADAAVNRWYKEGDEFSYSYPHISDKTNSFTQLVWKDTKSFGMGCAVRKGLLSNDVVVVALYSPPGNVKDEVNYNVLRSGEMASQKDDVYSNIF